MRHLYILFILLVLPACGRELSSKAESPPSTPDIKTCVAVDAEVTADTFSLGTSVLQFKLEEWATAVEGSAAAGEAEFSSLIDIQSRDYVTPTRKLKESEWPVFQDDMDFEWMDIALERQLKRYTQRDLSQGTIKFGSTTYPLKDMRTSLERFRDLISAYSFCRNKSQQADLNCVAEFNKKLREQFDVFVPDLKPSDPRYGENKPTLFTAYYTPTLEATLDAHEEYPHPIYARPPDRYMNRTRQEIDFKGALNGLGLELFYTQSLFELYLLHVQGGGKARVVNLNGTVSGHYLTYDGTNGKKWTFISNYMTQKGYISNPSIEAQRAYLRQNPDKQEEIFSTCPSYVYFKVTDEPPHGSDMVPLTDYRSIATDTAYYRFKGALAYVEARRPVNPYDPDEQCERGKFKDFSRFYLDQDTGGAIKGKARVDLYFGESPYAEIAAYNTKERGNLYFLMIKK